MERPQARRVIAHRANETCVRKAGAASIPDIHGCAADFQQPECEEAESCGQRAGGNGFAG
jgi:hypothetical protein